MSHYSAEFFGTMLLIVLGDGVVAAVLLKGSKGENAGWLTIVVGWGIAVTLAIYAVGSISGAHINPALTLALAVRGDFPWHEAGGYMLAQLAGAFVGAIIVWIHYFPHWRQTPEADKKLAVFCTSPAIRNPIANLLSEVIATAVLVLGILFIGQNEFTQGLNPMVVGLLIISIGLGLGGPTGFAINPARDLGPRIAHFILPIHAKGHSDWSYAWIPVVGPMLGGILGVGVHALFF
ncbi:MAG: MIP/aquaporin family protein [Cytophagales bacterium]|nr:MIP/aquaporin family protein [Cytophagales bacterium]